jgi:hypothetical protein
MNSELSVVTSKPVRTKNMQSGESGRCWHTDRSCWLDCPDKQRAGWIRTICGQCGGFVGYRQEQQSFGQVSKAKGAKL